MQAGTVLEVRSWTKVCEQVAPVQTGCHWVYGFRTNAVSRPGDSGGAFVRGTTALGVLSGGNNRTSFAADLSAGLAVSGGYTVQLAVAAPAVASSVAQSQERVASGAPASRGGTLVVERDGTVTEFAIDAQGAWSFDAGDGGGGPYALSVKRGYDVSDSVAFG